MRATTLLIFFSLLSTVCLGDNLITIQTKGTGTTITTKQVGSNNTIAVYCGLGSFDGSLVGTHNCNNATINATVTGNSNILYQQSVWSNHDSQTWITTVNGNDNYSVIDVDEDDNTVTIIQTGNDNDAWILGSGDDNVYKIEQEGNDYYAKIMAFTSDANTWITQEGTGDHNAYVVSYNGAQNNTTRVVQKGSGIKDADIFFYSGGDNNEVNLTQQGDGAHTANMKLYTADYDIDVIQKGASNQSYTAQFNCAGSGCNKTISITQQ